MASTYTTNNGFLKPGDGEMDDTWGPAVNAGVTDLIDTALDGVVTLSLTGTTHALAVTDGAASDGRNRILICTGALAANNTITLTPNDAEKYFFVYNNTTGGFSVVFAQGGGSGTTVTIANGYWAIVRCDGTGTNANVTRVLDSLELGGTLKVAGLSITSVLRGADGTAAAPAYSFTSDSNTGMYRVGSDSLGVSAGGTLRVTIDTSGVTLTIPLLTAAGSALAPSHSFAGDPNSGMYSGGADVVSVAAGGAEKTRVTATGLGVLSTTVYQPFTLTGQGVVLGSTTAFGPADSAPAALRFGYYTPGDYGYVTANENSSGSKPIIFGGTYHQFPTAMVHIGGTLGTAPVKPLTVEGQGVFLDKNTTFNPNDSAGDCLRVGVDSATGRGYVTSSDGSAGTKSFDLVATSMCIPSSVIIGAAVGSSAGPFSVLQLDSTTQGFTPPRMTTAQRDAMGAATDGVMIYNSTTGKFQGRAAGAWVDFH